MKTSLKKLIKKAQDTGECSICGDALFRHDPDGMAGYVNACWHAEKACEILERIIGPKLTDYDPYSIGDLLKQVMRLERHILDVRLNIRPSQTVTITR